jgi:single-strand DNA-binding protein
MSASRHHRPQADSSRAGVVGGAPKAVPEEVIVVSAKDMVQEEVNEVTLVGRMSQPAEEQVMPSGSQLWKFRVIVGRPPSAVSRVTVDTLDCVVWTKRPARTVSGWRTGDLVEVRGSLRRRFFAPAGGGRVSRCEVEVTAARLIRRADG